MDYVTVNTILSKFHRDLKDDINESDAIDWIGEALEFLKVRQIQKEAVLFLEVENFETDVPRGLQMVTQIARDNDSTFNEKVVAELPENLSYNTWTATTMYRQRYTPVKLANHVFFNTMVCKEKNMEIYQSCEDEYTIVGTVEKKLRFSFRSGLVALAYVTNALDDKTGYPLIPDNISYITAITYYIKWKIAEMRSWNGREGFARLAVDSERLWIKYCGQGKSYMKMPKSIDDYQDLLNQSHHLIPKQNRYYNYFGNLGTAENRGFNTPRGRNNSLRTR